MSASAPFCHKTIQIIAILNFSIKGKSYHISRDNSLNIKRENLQGITCKI